MKNHGTTWMGLILIGFAAGLSAQGCGGGGGSSTPSGSSTMSGTLPTDVVISSLTASAAASPSVNKGGAFKADATSDYETKKAALDALVAGTGECTFTAVPFQGLANAQCYGPQVTYVNHPTKVPGNSNFGGGDLGIWNETNVANAAEACAAAQMNNVISYLASRVDNMVNIMGVIACAGVKGGKTPPAVGSTLDLTSVVSSYVSIPGVSITSATLERLADDGSNAVYRLIISGTLTDGGTSYPFSITAKHIPTATDNSTYKGKLSYSVVTETGKPGNCNDPAGGISAATAEGSVYAGVILYEKSSATSVTYESSSAPFCGATTNPFDSNKNIDPADSLSAANPDGWDGFHYALVNIDPTKGTGSAVSGWVAGYGNESSRSLYVTTTEASDGSASGFAYFGYGPSMQSSTPSTIGSMTGMQCNWGSGVPLANKVQAQALARAAGGTVFGSVASGLHITFAPTDTCDATAGGFQYSSDQTLATAPMTNDHIDGMVAVTNNLEDMANMQFTRPTPPTDVGG